jgi:hypothetical protein
MRVIQFILASALCGLTLSCSENTESVLPVYDIVGLSDPETVLLSSLCDDIEYIPLKTGDQLMGNVRGIRYSAGRYAIQSGSSITVFESDGERNFAIDKQGKGPEDYLNGNVFDFDGTNNEILVYDSGHNRILTYNDKGEIVREIKNIKSVISINLLDEGMIFLSSDSHGGDSEFSHVIIDTGGDTLVMVENKFRFEPTVMMVFVNECVTYSKEDRLFYHDLMDDTIFCVDKQFSVYPHAVLNTGDLRFTVEKRANISMTGRIDAIFVSDIIETEDHFFVECSGKGHLVVKNDEETIVLEDGVLQNDIDGGMPFYPDLLVDEKYLVQLVDAFKFNLWLESDSFKNFGEDPQKKEKFRTLAESLTENNNPVLVRCRLK